MRRSPIYTGRMQGALFRRGAGGVDRASNVFESAVATAIVLYGAESSAALAMVLVCSRSLPECCWSVDSAIGLVTRLSWR